MSPLWEPFLGPRRREVLLRQDLLSLPLRFEPGGRLFRFCATSDSNHTSQRRYDQNGAKRQSITGRSHHLLFPYLHVGIHRQARVSSRIGAGCRFVTMQSYHFRVLDVAVSEAEVASEAMQRTR